MHLRDENIIVCDCGSELNPEIVTPQDFIKYDGTTATCSKCGASGGITFPVPETPAVVETVDMVALDATVTELVMTLNEKGLIP